MFSNFLELLEIFQPLRLMCRRLLVVLVISFVHCVVFYVHVHECLCIVNEWYMYDHCLHSQHEHRLTHTHSLTHTHTLTRNIHIYVYLYIHVSLCIYVYAYNHTSTHTCICTLFLHSLTLVHHTHK